MKPISLLMILAVTIVGCSSLAQLVESEVPTVFEPDSAVLEEDHCELSYSWCVEGICVEKFQSVTEFAMELEDGTSITCVGVNVKMTWVDGSSNNWLWPGLDSAPECEAEMQRLALEDAP